MREFAYIFHVPQDLATDITPAEMQERMNRWMNWMGGIAARDRLVDKGNRLGRTGSKWVGAKDVVSDGPYTEVKEFINGYMIVKAESVDEAVEMAKGCPLLAGGVGKLEVRPLVAPDDNR